MFQVVCPQNGTAVLKGVEGKLELKNDRAPLCELDPFYRTTVLQQCMYFVLIVRQGGLYLQGHTRSSGAIFMKCGEQRKQEIPPGPTFVFA